MAERTYRDWERLVEIMEMTEEEWDGEVAGNLTRIYEAVVVVGGGGCVLTATGTMWPTILIVGGGGVITLGAKTGTMSPPPSTSLEM